MLALVGLGNPGEQYARHRHNVGFMAIEAIARQHDFSAPKQKFKSLLWEGRIAGDKTLLVQPQTFMNESGQALREIANFYKLAPEDFYVFYDELDLPPGKIKMKTGGGHAGHNGIRSIDQHLGNQFHRVRIGIGHPGDRARVTGHVLGNFSASDHQWLDPLLQDVAQEITMLKQGSGPFLSALAQRRGNTDPRAVTPKGSPQTTPKAERNTNTNKATTTNAPPSSNRSAIGEALDRLFTKKD